MAKPPPITKLYVASEKQNHAIYEALKNSRGLTIKQLQEVVGGKSRVSVTAYLWRLDSRLSRFGWRVVKLGLAGKDHLYDLIKL